jgi:hypothetical protein
MGGVDHGGAPSRLNGPLLGLEAGRGSDRLALRQQKMKQDQRLEGILIWHLFRIILKNKRLPNLLFFDGVARIRAASRMWQSG